jgi:superfamily II DNA or RNA helicase
MNLRDYQQRAVESALEALENGENNSTLIVMPTGCGKTVVFASIIERWKRGRIMVLAHREELITQAAEKIKAITGEDPDIEMADRRADTGMWNRARVVVSSIQTQNAGNPPRMRRFNPGDFGLVIIDEAHHAVADSYRRVIEHFNQSKILGVTATPDRTDEAALGQVFDSVAFVYELNNAISDGWLVPIHQTSVAIASLDYSQVRVTAGDLNQADIARVQSGERVIHEMAAPIVDLAKGRRTIIFATPGAVKGEDFKIAERMTEILNRYVPESARRVSMDTPKDERRQILRDYKDGRFQFLVNVGVLTEGFDEPGIEVVAITRPTCSRALFAQMIGRGTRPLPGVVDGLLDTSPIRRRDAILSSRKPSVEVIDFVGNAGRHKLVHAADVLGGSYDPVVVERATAALLEDGGDVNEALERAEQTIREEKQEARRLEEERRRAITAKVQYAVESIDPFDILDIAAPVQRGWDVGHPPTPRQKEILESNGIVVTGDMTKRQAHAIIDEIFDRKETGRVGFKQARQLKALGHDTNMSTGEAMNILFQARFNPTGAR